MTTTEPSRGMRLQAVKSWRTIAASIQSEAVGLLASLRFHLDDYTDEPVGETEAWHRASGSVDEARAAIEALKPLLEEIARFRLAEEEAR